MRGRSWWANCWPGHEGQLRYFIDVELIDAEGREASRSIVLKDGVIEVSSLLCTGTLGLIIDYHI